MGIKNYFASSYVEFFGRKGDRNGRFQRSRWGLLFFPLCFSFVGIYLIVSTSAFESISVSGIIVKNIIFPFAALVIGFFLALPFWLRWFRKFKKGITIKGRALFWNKDGVSWAFALLCFGVVLQILAIWGDSKWDKTDISGMSGFYTQSELEAMPSKIGGRETGSDNGITQLRRQFSIGVMPFQVGEFVKVFFMIFLAKLLADMSARNQIRLCPQFFVLLFFAILPIGIFTFIMPNKSMLIMYVLLMLLMVWVQKMSLGFRFFIMIIPVSVAVLLVASIVTLNKDDSLLENKYYVKRVWIFFNEDKAVEIGEEKLKNAKTQGEKIEIKREIRKIKDAGQQQRVGLQALANGGIFGRGLDNGNIKYAQFAAQNDFAFSTLGEEFGLIMLLPFSFAMIVFLLTCFWIPLHLKVANYESQFAQNVAWGISFIFSLNILTHIFMNMRLIPNTGQPLSFVSAGSTNLAVNFFLMGMLVQISSMKKEKIR